MKKLTIANYNENVENNRQRLQRKRANDYNGTLKTIAKKSKKIANKQNKNNVGI